MTLITSPIEVFKTITTKEIDQYKVYWNSIRPSNDTEFYKRFLFAFLSVHTTWTKNVDSYYLLRDLSWHDNINQLSSFIKQSGVGLHVMRTKGIWKFKNDFWADPKAWYKLNTEDWITYRGRLMDKCHGLGLAKTAFALEMCYPLECRAVCVDTHVIQLFGHSPKKMSNKIYRKIETDWVSFSDHHSVPSPLARCIYWDKKQHQTDSRYWSKVFENETRN